MGIHLNLAILLRDLAEQHQLAGQIVTLGEQAIDFDLTRVASRGEAIDATARSPAGQLFARLGFSATESIDINSVEGADHLFDLNADETPSNLVGKFDLVLNGGTLEHVFHVPNALAHVSRLLRSAGTVVHVLPCHNWVEHGFYQFSPSLMFDYYRAAGFDCLESMLISFSPEMPMRWWVRCAWPGQLGQGLAGALDGNIYLHLFAARRGVRVDFFPRPQQSLYVEPTQEVSRIFRPRWFLPFLLEDGVRRPIQEHASFDLGPERFQLEQGHAWVASLPELTACADTLGLPARSELILLEDGVPLGPAHAAHVDIRKHGSGRYSHWGESLYLSASDNSRPDRNGKSYRVLLPETAFPRR